MSNVSRIENLSPKRFKQIVERGKSLSDILRQLDIYSRDGRARKTLKDRIEKDQVYFTNYRSQYTVEDVKRVVQKSLCLSDVVRGVGLTCHGGNINTIKGIIERFDIDTSHFDRGKTFRRGKKQLTNKELFKKSSTAHRQTVKARVLKEDLIPYSCFDCGNKGKWQGKRLELQLDHTNGDRTDHRLRNLRWACPNCHSQTETWGNRK